MPALARTLPSRPLRERDRRPSRLALVQESRRPVLLLAGGGTRPAAALSGADMADLDALDRTGGAAVAHETPWW
jgi:hypothetical protein